ncbi:hypothetical protein [Chitinophaga qingshengii]|nr:hypothetical protein [Chitinophaga qingshengii]
MQVSKPALCPARADKQLTKYVLEAPFVAGNKRSRPENGHE